MRTERSEPVVLQKQAEGRMRTVYINGKFTAQQTTGVQRVATRLVQAVDAQLAAAQGQ